MIELVRWSNFRLGHTNKEFVMLLEHNEIDKETFLEINREFSSFMRMDKCYEKLQNGVKVKLSDLKLYLYSTKMSNSLIKLAIATENFSMFEDCFFMSVFSSCYKNYRNQQKIK